jgi:hypothetical protein
MSSPFPNVFGTRKDRRTLLPKLPDSKRHVFTRGPRSLQASLIPSSRGRDEQGPPPSDGWPGSRPEWKIWWAHERLGLQHGVHFRYQHPAYGGRLVIGGMVIDFVEIRSPIALSVLGRYWHRERGSARQIKDIAQRFLLAQSGRRLIFLDEEDCLKRPLYILKEALRGIDHSRLRQV